MAMTACARGRHAERVCYVQLVRDRLSKANLGDLETYTDGTPSHTAGN